MADPKTLILIGYKGCGKTHFGLRLSHILDRTFIDTDRLLEELYLTQYRSVKRGKEIFEQLGPQEFRALENQAIASLNPVPGSIIATGGGTLIEQNNQRLVKQLGLLIYLETDKEVLKQRMLEKDPPAFLNPRDIDDSFEQMYQQRKLIYEKTCDIKIDTHGQDEASILERLIQIAQVIRPQF